MITVTIDGNLTDDVELRFIPSGKAVASFTLASSERTKNAAGEWVDGEATFMRCQVWGRPAENLVESVKRGDRVVVVGKLKQRKYEKRDGSEGVSWEVTADEVAVSLKFRTVVTQKAQRSTATDDPWASTPVAASDEPPF